MGVWACVHYGVPNKGRLGSGVPHREPSVLHVIVEAVAGDLGASQASSQLPGGEGGADEGKSSCLTSRIGVCRGERETARDLHPEAGSVQPGEWRGLLEAGVQSSTSSSGVTPCLRGVGGGVCATRRRAGRPLLRRKHGLLIQVRFVFLILCLPFLLWAPGRGDIPSEEGGFAAAHVSQCVRVCVPYNANV